MTDRADVVEAWERRKRSHNDACAAYRMRIRLGLPPGEPDDDIPEEEAEERLRVVEAAKRAKGWADLTEDELAEILP